MSRLRKIKKVVYKKLRRWHGVAEDSVITIDPRLKGRKRMEILIHESLHVLFPEQTEDEVIHNSIQITRLLWSQGYRRIDNDEKDTLQDGTR